MANTTQTPGTMFWRLELIVIRSPLLTGETSAALEWIDGLLTEAATAGSRPH